VQGSPTWTAPGGTLGRIVAEARERVSGLRARESELVQAAERAPAVSGFGAALDKATVGVIAEVKRRSPSKGWINAGISAEAQASAYVLGGATAISVLTEPAHFGGSLDDLLAVREAVGVPVLKKDFHVDPIQLVEARALGASAALLIVRALSPADLELMTDHARRLALEVLVEVRDADELERALEAGATIVGINNRNLETLQIDPRTSERLLRLVPTSVVAIAESGIAERSDVERVALAGANAVLVGSVISAAADPSAAVAALSGVTRVPRGR
jgi:indole-3-glycerol phosphate synthase